MHSGNNYILKLLTLFTEQHFFCHQVNRLLKLVSHNTATRIFLELMSSLNDHYCRKILPLVHILPSAHSAPSTCRGCTCEEQTNVTKPAQPSLRLIEKQTTSQKNPEERFSPSQYIRRGITPDSNLREEEIKDREGGSSLQHSISMQHQALNLQKLCCRDIPASLMATLLPVTVATADEA